MPQKHPPASTAVSCPFAGDKGLSTLGFGIATAALDVLQATPRPSGSRTDNMARLRARNRNMRNLLGPSYFPSPILLPRYSGGLHASLEALSAKVEPAPVMPPGQLHALAVRWNGRLGKRAPAPVCRHGRLHGRFEQQSSCWCHTPYH